MLNGVCDNVLSDYLWARAVLLTSPTVATIGMSITIPLAIISDLLLGNANLTIFSIFGAIFVIIGFVFVNIDQKAWEAVFEPMKNYCRGDFRQSSMTESHQRLPTTEI